MTCNRLPYFSCCILLKKRFLHQENKQQPQNLIRMLFMSLQWYYERLQQGHAKQIVWTARYYFFQLLVIQFAEWGKQEVRVYKKRCWNIFTKRSSWLRYSELHGGLLVYIAKMNKVITGWFVVIYIEMPCFFWPFICLFTCYFSQMMVLF